MSLPAALLNLYELIRGGRSLSPYCIQMGATHTDCTDTGQFRLARNWLEDLDRCAIFDVSNIGNKLLKGYQLP